MNLLSAVAVISERVRLTLLADQDVLNKLFFSDFVYVPFLLFSFACELIDAKSCLEVNLNDFHFVRFSPDGCSIPLRGPVGSPPPLFLFVR